MRPLIGKQNTSRRRKVGHYQPPVFLDDQDYRPTNRKMSGGDFCSASNVQQMFKNLTELRQNHNLTQDGARTIETQYQKLRQNISIPLRDNHGTFQTSARYDYDDHKEERRGSKKGLRSLQDACNTIAPARG